MEDPRISSCLTIILCCIVGCAYGSVLVGNLSSPISNSSGTDVRGSDYKAGAGFLVIATFFLMGDYGLGAEEIQESRTHPGGFEAELATLKDRMSILEKVSFLQGKAVKVPSEEETFIDMAPLCAPGSDEYSSNSTLAYRSRVLGSITRTLEFVESHLDQLHTIEPAFALSALKVVDDKHGGELQKKYPISSWISQICSTFHDNRESESCNQLTKIWKSRIGQWKPASIIPKYGEEFNSIGTENEVIWGRLNGECQLALLTRCEVPYICERTLFDPNPRSQYMLTHQLLQRILAEAGTCSTTKDLVDPEVNHRLCAKIYKEAQLIHALKTPEILRDLFAEQIGMCGYMGYPNFLRQDWLDLIFSWQSKSDYGCFVRDNKGRNKFVTTDKAVKRQPTNAEKIDGIVPDEYCLPHFTSVSLTALATYWDYLEEKCNVSFKK